MEFEFSYFTILFSFLLFAFVLHKLINTRSNKSLNNLPPGPRKLPFIGNLHVLFSSEPPHRILRRLSAKYGPLMHLRLGEISTVVISSAEAAKHVMKTHDLAFASRPTFPATDILLYGSTNIVFSKYGEYWRHLKKICTSELLSAKRVQSFAPLRVREFTNLCRWIASNEGTTINFTERISLTSYHIITQASIGTKTDEQALFISSAKQALELVAGFNVADLYPSIKLFNVIGGVKKKAERVHQDLDRILEKIIDDHKRSSSVKTKDDRSKSPEDLLDVLLKFQDDPNLHITTNNIKAVLMDMFVAGIETSVTVVNWAMVEMLRHPRTLKAAQDEVRRVFDARRYVDESSFDEINYVRLVIKETLRMHPPVGMLVRESMEPREIDGYQILSKTRVLVNAWAIGRDPKYWEDPESFKPERFLKKTVDYKGNDFEYIPFGAGRRICPGITFGIANVELPLVMLLYHFDWTLPNQMKPEELDMTEHAAITVGRKEKLHVIPVVRRPVPVE